MSAVAIVAITDATVPTTTAGYQRSDGDDRQRQCRDAGDREAMGQAARSLRGDAGGTTSDARGTGASSRPVASNDALTATR